MADPFVAEIRILGCNFAPKGWAACNGQIIPISQNTALFSLLGTMYGGDGRSTFALPDLQGKAPMHWGNGPGLTPRSEGESSGSETVTLNNNTMPAHAHNLRAVNDFGDINDPTNNSLARSSGAAVYNAANAPLVQMSNFGVGQMGLGQAHNNMQPYLTLLFVIALQGVYPPRG